MDLILHAAWYVVVSWVIMIAISFLGGFMDDSDDIVESFLTGFAFLAMISVFFGGLVLLASLLWVLL